MRFDKLAYFIIIICISLDFLTTLIAFNFTNIPLDREKNVIMRFLIQTNNQRMMFVFFIMTISSVVIEYLILSRYWLWVISKYKNERVSHILPYLNLFVIVGITMEYTFVIVNNAFIIMQSL
jgi:hypothetical protein